MQKKILITGGAGFIGSSLIRYIIKNTNHYVLNIDKLTYAANLKSLKNIESNTRYNFEKTDICNSKNIQLILKKYEPQILIHLAAETHVDRSIDGPKDFIQTNICGTFTLLEKAREYWLNLSNKKNFRFLHVSTDEVYGDLGDSNDYFDEQSRYAPSSPYSASKAAADHLVRAWQRTYQLPTIITNCSNNYGPYQFPEKLIPLVILKALEGKELPIYGDGNQIRDWLYVEDHARALLKVAINGKVGDSYNIGGLNEIKNIDVVKIICKILNDLVPNNKFKTFHKYEELITFVDDRVGHDKRYAIDPKKISNELNWKPHENFMTGITKTVKWYLNNPHWCDDIKKNRYRGERLGKPLS